MLTTSVAGTGSTSASTILFSPAPEDGLSVSSDIGSDSNTIEVDLDVDSPPLPRKVEIDVPSGYSLDLKAKPGETVGEAQVAIYGLDAPSIAAGFGPLLAKDPVESLPDPRAQACAPGAHDAVWGMSTSLAGQQLSLPVYVDRVDADGVAYRLHVCPTGLASDARSEASISLGLDGLEAPTAPADYHWRALVTPQKRDAYELQAVLPLPESISLHARYVPKKKRAILTGSVVEGGKPVSGAELLIAGTQGEHTVGLFDGKTNAQGRFRATVHVTKTTDFVVGVGSAFGPCTEPAIAPGGCLGSTTIPPDQALSTVWVSVRGGAARAIRPADQRRAETFGLVAEDFPAGFEPHYAGGDNCLNPKGESALTITGESMSPAFVRYDLVDDTPILVQAASLSRVYASGSQARKAFAREARPSLLRCLLKEFDSEHGPIKPLGLRASSARVRAFRVAIPVDRGITVSYDFVVLQRGRGVTILTLAMLNAPAELERQLVGALASRLR